MRRIHETAAFTKTTELISLPDGPLNETLGSVFYKYTEVLEKDEVIESCS